MIFRKKPVLVEATQWFKNGDHPLDYVDDPDDMFNAEYRKEHGWEGEVVNYFRHPNVPDIAICEYCADEMGNHGLMGEYIICPGDWIITDTQGRYPCKPDIFEETYERVE